jgi:UDP-N-acetylglucosamine 4,6-dehydratase
MEGIFRQACEWGDTSFVLCRYGNVLRSANSIVPLFERQIKKDIPFTITDLQMTRFWLSMKQAVDLVIKTNEYGHGKILVPKAPAMTIKDLALALDPFREIVEIGIRPGERLHETLIVREEALHTEDMGEWFCVHSPKQKRHYESYPSQYEYTSNNPSYWLTVEGLMALMEDSPDSVL